jgi:hypothetical protein
VIRERLVGNLRVRFPEAIGGKLGDAGISELSPHLKQGADSNRPGLQGRFVL